MAESRGSSAYSSRRNSSSYSSNYSSRRNSSNYSSRRNSSVSFDSIKMLELPRVEVDRQFCDVRLLAENNGVKVFGARRLDSSNSVALKCVHKDATTMEDFVREFCFNYSLSSHPNIVKCFDEAFETSDSYAFAQEFAPISDLSKFIRIGGIGESRSKKAAEQVAQALEFMHKQHLVHRDVCIDNVFVFNREVTHFKLGDFGSTQPAGALVKKLNVRSPWAPPEVSVAVYNEGYHVHSAQDAWQLGIFIVVCLTGSYPWSSADITDPNYNSWVTWLKRKTTKTPPRFKCFTPRLLRLLRRLLEPKPEKRSGVREVYKYLSDPWLVKGVEQFNTSPESSSSESLSNESFVTRVEKKLAKLLHH